MTRFIRSPLGDYFNVDQIIMFRTDEYHDGTTSIDVVTSEDTYVFSHHANKEGVEAKAALALLMNYIKVNVEEV